VHIMRLALKIASLVVCLPFAIGIGRAIDPSTSLHVCPVDLEYSYYLVEGTTEAAIRSSMLQRGPKDEHGNARFAYASWKVKWEWPKGPDVLRTKLSCSASITLPRHAAPDTLPPEVRSQWEALVGRITNHELNHVKHMEERAPDILSRLHRVAATKNLTSEEANEIAQQVLLEIQEADRRYDRETEHGKSEGAWSF
jgi:predicted secreted Zn-dependent protease